jgi:thiol-disulfide isomerase/thioredoxin
VASVVVSAVLLVIVTTPLGTSGSPNLPDPHASAFLIGPPVAGLKVGALAPELSGTSSNGTIAQLQGIDGRPIRLADLRGKVVWLNFWASWCPPCQAETPVLRTMAQRYADLGLVLVGIDNQETVEIGRDYARRYGLPYSIAADVSGLVLHTYKVYALPTQFFIDENGVVRQIVNGPLDLATADKIVSALLATDGQSPPASPTGISASDASGSATP